MNPIRAPRLGIRAKLYLSHLLAVLLVCGSVGVFFYLSAAEVMRQSVRSRLQNSAALLSHTVDAGDLDRIHTPADTSLVVYQRLLHRLRTFRRANPDLTYICILRLEGERMLFVLDSDETEGQALPGREYPPVGSLVRQGFGTSTVDVEPYRDEWGLFYSGYAPIANGNGAYLISLDMRADEVDGKLSHLRLLGAASLLVAVFLALTFAFGLSRGISRRVESLAQRCRRIAAGQFGAPSGSRPADEFSELIQAFDQMSEGLAQAHARSERALTELQLAGENLERRVQERTQDLEQALRKVEVMRGLLPICASCKKIRDDQGYWCQVEQFVETHSEARFTHGLCPDCLTRHYGDILAG